MIIPPAVRKCVVFIGYEVADGSRRLAGSGFWLGRDAEDGKPARTFIATAKHVIDKIRSLGVKDIFLRGNTVQGATAWAKCQNNEWHSLPGDASVDIAVLPAGIPVGWDHLALHDSMFATPQVFAESEVALGEEVFVVGLFRHHGGTNRNIPIVRVGNLAALNEERVHTKDFGAMDAYLIEARSIGGLSGSPVFLNLGSIRVINGQIQQSPNGPKCFLLGLIHGHYDLPSTQVDAAVEDANDALSAERVNTGIAIVAPVERLSAVIDSLP